VQKEDNELVESQLRKLETDLLQPEVRRSPEALSSLLAEEFCEFGSSGRTYTKQAIIDYLPTQSPLGVSIDDFSVTILAAGVALVKYRAARRSQSVPGESISLRSSLWVRRDNRWQMIFHQGTKVSE
jgi:hypothetical protein